MALRNATTGELAKLFLDILIMYGPNVELIKNEAGNLIIDVDGEFHGFIDLRYAVVTMFSSKD